MGELDISSLGGFIVLFFMFIATYPLLSQGVAVLLDMTGNQSLGLFARAIPLLVGLAILTALWNTDKSFSTGGRR